MKIMIHFIGRNNRTVGAVLVDEAGNPSYVTLGEVKAHTGRTFENWLADNNDMEEIDHRNLDMRPSNTSPTLRGVLAATEH